MSSLLRASPKDMPIITSRLNRPELVAAARRLESAQIRAQSMRRNAEASENEASTIFRHLLSSILSTCQPAEIETACAALDEIKRDAL